MNLGRWLRGATRIRFDDRTLGNLTKNVATGAGAIMGGPAGLAIAGLGNAAGQAALPGSNIGDIVGAGAKGAATSFGLNKAGGMLKGLASGGGSAAAPSAVAPTTAAPSSVTGISPIAPGAGAPASVLGQPVSSAANLASATANATSGGGPGVFRSALNFVGRNPTATAMGLQGLGSVATSGAENRMNDAQTRLLNQRYELTEDERKRRAEQDRWMSQNPLRLAAQPMAPNPYAVG